MENVDAEREAALRDQQAKDATGDLSTPKDSINRNACQQQAAAPLAVPASPSNSKPP
jgi:hypothetical protein